MASLKQLAAALHIIKKMENYWSAVDKFCERAKPFTLIILMQFGYAGMSIISKSALNAGMSQHVLVVYRHAIATLVMSPFAFFFERKIRPKMTFSILVKILLLGLLEPTIDQNLFYTGMKYTTATFANSMCNILPAFAFLMAYALRLEKVNIRKRHSQAKVLGTMVAVSGAMIMTLVRGSKVNFPWTNGYVEQAASAAAPANDQMIKGAIFITTGCCCWAGFVVLQAITLKSYSAPLSLTVLICFAGTIQGSLVAAVMERGNPSAWILHFDSTLLACVYSGVVSSGIAYYVQGLVMKTRGPVFVTSFNPLSMIIVTILGSFILSETVFIGRVIGSGVIVLGLYLVLWGKSKDKKLSTVESIDDSDEKPENEKQQVSDKDFVTVDVNRIKPTQESV